MPPPFVTQPSKSLLHNGRQHCTHRKENMEETAAEMTLRTTVTVACRRFRWISFPFSKAIGGHQKAYSRGGGMSDEDEMALPG
ncbi:hypothetical protein L2E82_05033 [Cichorium intybus]|uniref:Uncharacterized protein n=1 Tax=Cichorium intybus TaxID=13427 RepID=A0ACB9H813_CICIN|nr:hypothetical protein L2E82_05033 [Cichorium intybus]